MKCEKTRKSYAACISMQLVPHISFSYCRPAVKKMPHVTRQKYHVSAVAVPFGILRKNNTCHSDNWLERR